MRRLFPAAALLAFFAGAARAQGPANEWRTIETRHFRVHYPADSEAWAMRAAERLEPIRDAVSREVGFAPPQRIDVLVMNPIAEPNGSAWTLLNTPRIIFFSEPPGPDEQLGAYGTWIDLLAVHEVAHVVHMLRPSRNVFERLVERSVLPLNPITLRAPRWVLEGYATVVEGRITGAGRPSSTLRALVLRQWAENGRLPSYGQLNSDRRFLGMSMAYLMGSAFLEWLELRNGPDALRNVWARMTARQRRSFDSAFAGVFGESPERLYGQFVAEVTASAVAVRRARTLQDGVLFQETPRASGDPAVSPDGSRLAVVIRERDQPETLVVWSTGPAEEEEKADRERIEKILARDPEDVAPIRTKPLPRKAKHELVMPDGGDIRTPRWTRDGKAIVFAHRVPDGEGVLHFDLYLWDFERVTRITHRGDVRDADALDDTTLIAVRSAHGLTELVNVDLRSGAVTPFVSANGSPSSGTSFRSGPPSPRAADLWPLIRPPGTFSPHGGETGDRHTERELFPLAPLAGRGCPEGGREVRHSIGSRAPRGALAPNDTTAPSLERVVATPRVSPDGRVAFIAHHGGRWTLFVDGEPIELPGDAATPAWLANDELLVTVFERGFAELYRVRGAAAAPITRTGGGAFEPAPANDGRVFFMSLEPDGSVVRVLEQIADAPPAPMLEASLAPAIPPIAATATALARESHEAPSAPRPYGIGRQELAWFASANVAPDQQAIEAGVRLGDVVGRLDTLLVASFARDDAPRGVALASAWRGWPVELHAHAFHADDETGGELRAVWSRRFPRSRVTFEGGALGGDRDLLFASGAFATEQHVGASRIDETVRIDVDDDHWRGTASAAFRAGSFRVGARYQHDGGANVTLGGLASSILPRSAYAHRILDPALPVAIIGGGEYDGWRIEMSVPGLPLTAFYQRHELGAASLSLAGAEFQLRSAPNPIVKVPGLDLSLGAAQVFDAPLRGETKFWIGMHWRP